jgi:hypothetical protein
MVSARRIARRISRRAFWALASLVVAATALYGSASAATTLVEPTGNPFVIPLDAAGNPAAFTIVASGFPPGTLVYVEQCGGRPSTDAHWRVTLDCDTGTSPSSAIVDANGVARFNADDHNRAFRPIMGPSPSGNFNCLPEGASSPKNGLADYRSCFVRVSSNNYQATDDQLFLPFVLRTKTSSSSSSSSRPWIAALIVVAAAGIVITALVLFTRRRSTHRA